MARLPLAELARRIGLDDVVDPRRAAADVLFGRFYELELWDSRERRARNERKPLRVAEVTGVL